jgi:hypothetical protein
MATPCAGVAVRGRPSWTRVQLPDRNQEEAFPVLQAPDGTGARAVPSSWRSTDCGSGHLCPDGFNRHHRM